MLAEGFFQPFSLPGNLFLIVTWWGTTIFEVCKDVLAGIFEKITAGPLQTSHFHFLLSWWTVVDPFLGKDHESSPLQNGSRVSIGYVAESWAIFFLRLPIGQYGPVSQLSRSEERCTGPFNWGEAHCAGEKVKRKIGPFLRKSLKNQTRTRTQQKGAQPATATRNPLARLPGARAKEETNPTNKRLHQQILVRLNVLDLQWTIL